ncbi:ATP-binding protein [Thermopolyspora sp. NPDC052614]|uniref:ATP-binding protein n=1 Tax=Thermopolyspora sp. NPDC052614 TaxID=3155682 RepID=UPI003420AE12
MSTDPLSAAFARRHVGRVLTSWGRRELIEAAQLIISELVTNALKAAAEPPAPPDPYIWIGLHQANGRVVLEVWDPSRTPPKLVDPGPDALGGRGLLLVDDLAADWGYRWPRTGGKVVWAALKTEG